ncbi:MAG TPA: hypothetical protein VLL52_23920, partial [Anaerolineae bacterium]|nr:hypothetical protein [Anaerolineae bacterium]
AGVIGFVVYVVKLGREEGLSERDSWWGTGLATLFDVVERHFPVVVCLIWSAGIVASLTRWASITWSSQGRLVFTALAALHTLLLLGLVGWWPEGWRVWSRRLVAGVGVFIGIVAFLVPWVVIGPAYGRERPLPPQLNNLQPFEAEFGDEIVLRGYEIVPDTVLPGEVIDVGLAWEVVGEVSRDWSTFIHLIDPVLGVPISQRDMYPQAGLTAATDLAVGERWEQHYRLRVPETAVSPANLMVGVGWYDVRTGERLLTAAGEGGLVLLGEVALRAGEGAYPNPLAVNFEDRLRLVGYELAPRRGRAGETLAVTLYWELLEDVAVDYTFFGQVVAEDTTRWASADVGAGTSAWAVGEVMAVTLPLTIREEAVPAVYPLIVGMYTRTEDGGFDRLQRKTAEGHLTDDFLRLTVVRVDP